MPFSVLFSGSDLFSTTEESICNNTTATTAQSITTDAVVQLWLDCNAITAADVFVIQGKEKCRTGDTQRVFLYEQLTNMADQPLWVSPPFQLTNGWDWTIKKVSGTDRTIAWEIRAVS